MLKVKVQFYQHVLDEEIVTTLEVEDMDELHEICENIVDRISVYYDYEVKEVMVKKQELTFETAISVIREEAQSLMDSSEFWKKHGNMDRYRAYACEYANFHMLIMKLENMKDEANKDA